MTTKSIPSPMPVGEPPVPPLREGDRMDCFEFERRWLAMPDPRPRAELLEGEVHFMAPIGEEFHATPQRAWTYLLTTYELATPGTLSGGSASLKLNRSNMPEPDAYLRILETHGGQTRRSANGVIEGAAELVVEIAASSGRKDLGKKFGIYRRQGVREYIVWRTGPNVIDWFRREDDRFDPVYPDDQSVIRSTAFPGLWVDVRALVLGDLAVAVKTLRRGLETPEHAEFVARLRAAAEGTRKDQTEPK